MAKQPADRTIAGNAKPMLSKLDNHFALQSTVLDLRARRQQMIASNIANADTPHYKATDIDFSRAFADAMAGRGAGAIRLEQTAPGHLPARQAMPEAHLQYRQEIQSAVDGNTVDMDVERAAFADNALRYEASITFLNGRLRGLLDAMQPAR